LASEETPANTEAAAPAEAAVAPAAEPETIEVWRPGRPPGERQKRDSERRGRRRRPARQPSQREGQSTGDGPVATTREQATNASIEVPAPGEPDREQRESRGRSRHRRPDGAAERDARPERRADRSQRRDRSERPERSEWRNRPERSPRRERDRRDDARPSRTWSSSQEQRGKEPDPNSPFAKLLVLKEQLESNKERR
jgi:ATP-dependent RNA helicase SUPV3L1/SUV3